MMGDTSKGDNDRPLGVTKEYNSENRARLWDSEADKRRFKDEFFDGKKTAIDPVTGETLHYSQGAAQNKFHMKNKDGENSSVAWAGHSAEVDHVISLKKIHDRNKNNPFLTDADIKAAANKKHNYTVTSKKFNAAKGERSNLSVALDKDMDLNLKGRARLISDQAKAELLVGSDLAARTAVNASGEFVQGAADSLADSTVILISEGARHLVNVARNEESAEEAVKGAATTVAGVAVTGGVNRLTTDILKQSSNKVLNSIAKSGHLNQITTAALILTESAVRYINGDINEEEFKRETTEKALGLVISILSDIALKGLGPLGMVAAPVASQVISCIITTVACGAVFTVKDVFCHIDDYKLKEAQIRRLEATALREIENQQAELKQIIEQEYGRWDMTFQEGFDIILSSALDGDKAAEGIARGLDKILGVFDKKVAFSSLDEYEAQLDSTLTIKF